MVVIKPLYGITEAGTYQQVTYFNYHYEKLSMVTLMYDPCLLITSLLEYFSIVGMQTDDTLMLCNTKFSQLEEDKLNKTKFTAKPKEKLTIDNPLLFNRYTLTKEVDSSICLY